MILNGPCGQPALEKPNNFSSFEFLETSAFCHSYQNEANPDIGQKKWHHSHLEEVVAVVDSAAAEEEATVVAAAALAVEVEVEVSIFKAPSMLPLCHAGYLADKSLIGNTFRVFFFQHMG
jgi:hypothetical protein